MSAANGAGVEVDRLPRSRMRYLSWTLGTDGDADPPQHAAECVECGQTSGECDGWEPVQDWCLAHAAHTWHGRFKAQVTGCLLAAPTEPADAPP